MSPQQGDSADADLIGQYLRQLADGLRTRGRARRRLLAESHDHLDDAAATHGAREAIHRFGSPSALAAAFDTEVAARSSLRATVVSLIGVLTVAASTLALVDAAVPTSGAVIGWAVVFFTSAQAAGVCACLALLQATAMRQRQSAPADVALLCRRNTFALVFAGLALFAAGAAVPGQAPAWQLLAGPLVAALAALQVVRVRWVVRKLITAAGRQVQRPPMADLLDITPGSHALRDRRLVTFLSDPVGLLAPTVLIAAAAAFCWDHLDGGTPTSSLTAAAIEAAATLTGYLLLGRRLGLWSPRTHHQETTA